MKTNMKKVFAYVLALTLAMVLSLTAFAAAETTAEPTRTRDDGYSEYNGVKVTTTTEKEDYSTDTSATFKVTVENTNSYDIEDITISYTIPASFTVADTSLTKDIASIAAGEKYEFEVNATFMEGLGGESAFPTVLIIVIAVVVVLAVALICLFIFKGKKGKKATISAILILALTGSTIVPMIGNAEDVKAAEAETSAESSDYSRAGVHDPSIVKDPSTGTYYIFGSHMAWAKSTDLKGWKKFTMNINTDYSTLLGDLWKNYCTTPANSNLSGNLWAPDVVYNETMKKWCMYMSVNGNNWQSVIALLTADNIEGPYEYAGNVTYSGFTKGNDKSATAVADAQKRADYSDVYKVLGAGADLSRYNTTNQSCVNDIDPSIQIDDDGTMWMTYGSWSAGIYQMKLDNATGLRDYNKTYEYKVNESDPYLGYKIAGGYYNSGEGPYILHTGNYYYLFISYGNLEQSGGYNMRIFRSEKLNGPYVDENGNSAIYTSFMSSVGYSDSKSSNKYNINRGIKIFGSYSMYGVSKIQAAQGHNSAFVDDNGKIYLVYHTRFANTGEAFEDRVHQMFVNEDGWLVAAPYEYADETLPTTSYATDDIVGDYQFILHDYSQVFYQKSATEVTGVAGVAAAETEFVVAEKAITVSEQTIKLQFKMEYTKATTEGETVTLNKDGTITGSHKGTWKVSNGANVVMTIDNVEYKGVFLKQQNELQTKDQTMTFSVLGGNQTLWGIKKLK